MELPSIGMIKSFVAADLGVSLISASFARDEVDAGRVKLIDLEDAELYRELGLAYRRDRTLSVASTAFVGSLAAVRHANEEDGRLKTVKLEISIACIGILNFLWTSAPSTLTLRWFVVCISHSHEDHPSRRPSELHRQAQACRHELRVLWRTGSDEVKHS